MSDPFVWIFGTVAFALIVFALRLFWQRNYGQSADAAEDSLRTQKDENGNIDFVRCPVCNTPLSKSDNLSSKVFRPMDTPDQRMIVMGCPHCYPVPQAGIKRACPVCGKTIPTDGYLVARLFNHAHNKKHVIITSCSEEQKKR